MEKQWVLTDEELERYKKADATIKDLEDKLSAKTVCIMYECGNGLPMSVVYGQNADEEVQRSINKLLEENRRLKEHIKWLMKRGLWDRIMNVEE